MFEAISEIHKRHLIHGDIKPENVIWRGHGQGRGKRLAIVDFGATQFFRHPRTKIVRREEDGGFITLTTQYASTYALGLLALSQRDDAISAFLTLLALEGKYGDHDKRNRGKNAALFDSRMIEWLEQPIPQTADKVYMEVWKILSRMQYGDDIPPEVPRLFRSREMELRQRFDSSTTPQHGRHSVRGDIACVANDPGKLNALLGALVDNDMPRVLLHGEGTYAIRIGRKLWTLAYEERLAVNVYKAFSHENGEEVTIKFGTREGRYVERNYNEANMLHELQDLVPGRQIGIPSFGSFGELRLASSMRRPVGALGKRSVLTITTPLRQSLAENLRGRKSVASLLSASVMRRNAIRRSCAAGLQLLASLECMHSKNIIYNSAITPENVFVGKNGKKLYLLDFTRARYFVEDDGSGTLSHILPGEDNTVPVNRYLSSASALEGRLQSRRDDLESLLYTMVQISGVNVDARRTTGVLEQFLSRTRSMEPFAKFLSHIKELNFDSNPDYRILRRCLVDGANGYEF